MIDSVTRRSVLSKTRTPSKAGERAGVYVLSEAELDGARRVAAEPLDGVGDDDAAIFDDREPVDDALDLVEFV